MSDVSIYIVRVKDNDESFDYEYGNLGHALEQYYQEIVNGFNPLLFEYNNGKYYLVDIGGTPCLKGERNKGFL